MITKVYKPFGFDVTAANQLYKVSFELDKNVVQVKGLMLGTTRPDLLYVRGSQRIEVSKVEIFPDGYLSQWLMVGVTTSMNQRFHELKNVVLGNRTVKIDFLDTDDGRTIFGRYKYYIVLECEVDDTL
jgi:hypothetical protein